MEVRLQACAKIEQALDYIVPRDYPTGVTKEDAITCLEEALEYLKGEDNA